MQYYLHNTMIFFKNLIVFEVIWGDNLYMKRVYFIIFFPILGIFDESFDSLSKVSDIMIEGRVRKI